MENFDSEMATLSNFKEIGENSHHFWIWNRYLLLYFPKHYSDKTNTDAWESTWYNNEEMMAILGVKVVPRTG